MRLLLIGTSALIFLGGAPVDVDAASIKHLKSIYVDQEGGRLALPKGVTCDDKTVVVADTGNARLAVFSWEAQILTPKSVLPLAGIKPGIIQMNSRGELFLLDGKTRTIKKIGADGLLAGELKPTKLPDSRPFIPRSFRIDHQDNFYLLDLFSARILILDATGQFLRQIPFPTEIGYISDLEINKRGTLYLLDSVAGAIYTAEQGEKSFAILSQGLKEYMNFPTHLAVDRQDTIYLSDQYGSGLVLVGPDGSFLGRKFSMGWEDGQFNYPTQICIDGQNRLFVADKNNSRVQVFSLQEE
ncbi:MAG: NHL repeat-containing protein [Desulfuromonadales bacterium]|nr:NHL repeat-containing protein [Desulfuromonadales bacterium]